MLFRKSPLTPLFQRGGFLPFVKGGEEEFNLQCLHNYGLISKSPPIPLFLRGKIHSPLY
jgi:hypothetical protein